MFRLMSYILNSKLIDDNQPSYINAEPSSSSHSENITESDDVQEDEKNEIDEKSSTPSSSPEKCVTTKNKNKSGANLKKDKIAIAIKKKSIMSAKARDLKDKKDKNSVGGGASSSDTSIKLKTEKTVTRGKTKTPAFLEKSKTRIDFPKTKKAVKKLDTSSEDDDDDDIPLKKLKESCSKDDSKTSSTKKRPAATSKNVDDDESPKNTKKSKFKVVQPKKIINKTPSASASVKKTAEKLPTSTSAVSSSPKTETDEQINQKKPKSEIERLKELEAQMAKKKPKLKISKNIVKELKEKDELLLKAKATVGECSVNIVKDLDDTLLKTEATESESPKDDVSNKPEPEIPTENVNDEQLKKKNDELVNEEQPSKPKEEPITLTPASKLTTPTTTSEPASSTSYDDVKSPSTTTFSTCVSPCFSEATVSLKDESIDGESMGRSISPTNSESTIIGHERSRSRTKKRKRGVLTVAKSGSRSRRSSRSVSEDGSMGAAETPVKSAKRMPKRPGIVFDIGCKLEAMDFQEKWYMAKIVEIDKEKAEILIHFDGWSSRFDEWISMHSKKLRAVTQDVKPAIKKNTKKKLCQQFKAGEKVLARWNDSKMYPATIKETQPENYYMVEFYDGFVKKLLYSSIAKVPSQVVEKLTHPLPLATVKKLQTDEELSKDPLLKNILNKTPTDDDSSLNSPTFVPKKLFKVEEDHNQFKCNFENCNKSFRKESLLDSHIKHYHRPPKPPKVKATPKKPKIAPIQTSTPVQSSQTSSDPSTPIVKAEVTDEPKKENEVKMELDESPLPSATPIQEVTPPPSLVVKDENQSPKTSTPDAKLPLVSSNTDCLVKTPLAIPPKMVGKKGIYPITKMETRHAKLRFQKDDSIYTNYKTVALGLQKPRRVSESKPDRIKPPPVKNERTVGRPKANSESSTKGPGPGVKQLNDKKVLKNRGGGAGAGGAGGERKVETSVANKSEVKKPKLEKVTKTTDISKAEDDLQEKKDTSIGPVTRRRSDRFSESTSASKTDEAVKDDLDEVTEIGEDTIDDKDEGNNDDEVVHCICEVNEENGLMIQCEVCMTWQHGSCFNIDVAEQVPDKYICYACTNPRGLRRSFKYRLDQEYFKSGELPTFNEMGTNCKQSCSILAAHELVSSMHNIVNVLHTLDYKINLAKEGVKDNSDLKYFSKPWDKLSASNESLNESTLTAKSTNLDSELTLDAETTEQVLKAIADEGISDPKEPLIDENFMNSIPTSEDSARDFPALDHSYFNMKDNNGTETSKLLEIPPIKADTDKGQPDNVNLNSACSSIDSTTATTTTTTEDTDVDFATTSVSGGPSVTRPSAAVVPEDISDSETELRTHLLETKTKRVTMTTTTTTTPATATKSYRTGGMPGRRRGRFRRGAHLFHQPQHYEPLPKVEEVYDTEVCKENLLEHISDVQLNLENKLDLIEGQLKILETEYGEDPSDQDQYAVDSEDEDLPKLLQSIKNLSKDLTLVERLAIL